MRFHGQSHRIDLARLTGGKCITVYGQHEVVKDLIAARVATGRPLLFDVADVRVTGIDTKRPQVASRTTARVTSSTAISSPAATASTASAARRCRRTSCASTRSSIPSRGSASWSTLPRCQDELVYACHDRGFALFSMRSPTITRLYVRCAPEDDLGRVARPRIWHELHTRLETKDGWKLNEGPMLQRGITPMRGSSPSRCATAGCSSRATRRTSCRPPVRREWTLRWATCACLARLAEHYREGRDSMLDRYSEICLRRVWKGERFSWHVTLDAPPLPRRRQVPVADALAELDYYTGSVAGRDDPSPELRRAADRTVTTAVWGPRFRVRSNFGDADPIALVARGCRHDAPPRRVTPSTVWLVSAGG